MRICCGAAWLVAAPLPVLAAPGGMDDATYSTGLAAPAPLAAPEGTAPMRDVARVGAAPKDGGKADIAPALMALDGDFWVYARVTFTVTTDDAVEGCGGADARMLMGKGVLDEAAVTEAACALVAARQNFVHALDANGNPVSARMEQRVWFRRMLATSPGLWRKALPPPAPPLPPGNFAWPAMVVPGNSFAFVEPQWGEFVPSARGKGEHVVGVLFDTDGPHAPSGCKIGLPSGDPAFDAAVCKAIEATTQTYAPLYAMKGYPLKVVRDGKGVRTVLPETAVGPAFAGYGQPLPARQSAPAGPPAPGVTIRLSTDRSGKPVDCHIRQGSGSDALDIESCRAAMAQTRIAPARDVFGDAAPGSLALLANWTDGIWGVPID